MKYITAEQNKQIDIELMENHGFLLPQLMELAGSSISAAISREYKPCRTCIVCGPGNNGGDGLVCARHLKKLGFDVSVFYPVKGKKELYEKLAAQCKSAGISFVDNIQKHAELIIDAVFGFGFKGELRDPFNTILKEIKELQKPVVSIDIPLGWDVEKGNVDGKGIDPDMVISLSAPKLCMKGFRGIHYLGFPFLSKLPKSVSEKFELDLPDYDGDVVFRLQ